MHLFVCQHILAFRESSSSSIIKFPEFVPGLFFTDFLIRGKEEGEEEDEEDEEDTDTITAHKYIFDTSYISL